MEIFIASISKWSTNIKETNAEHAKANVEEHFISSNSNTNLVTFTGRRAVIKIYFPFRLFKSLVARIPSEVHRALTYLYWHCGTDDQAKSNDWQDSLSLCRFLTRYMIQSSLLILCPSSHLDFMHFSISFDWCDISFKAIKIVSHKIHRNVNRNTKHDRPPVDIVNESDLHTSHKCRRWPRTLAISRFPISFLFIPGSEQKGSNQRKICRNLFEFDMAFYFTCSANANTNTDNTLTLTNRYINVSDNGARLHAKRKHNHYDSIRLKIMRQIKRFYFHFHNSDIGTNLPYFFMLLLIRLRMWC